MKKVKINDMTIRDIFQSVDERQISERLFTRIVENLGKANFDSLEVFGGSAFEKMLGNLFRKTPFEIAYDIKSRLPKTVLQALISARNLVGMEAYSKPVIKKFIEQCIKSGIERFKVFDALNDIENFKYTISVITEKNSHCQGTIIYDDFQDLDFYLDLSKELENAGCSSICIKDAESTLLPKRSQELFKKLTAELKIPVFLSVYNLRGLQVSNYYNACLAGCSGVDLSFIPSSYNDLSPAVFPLILSFKDTGFTIDLDYIKLLEIFEWSKQNLYPLIRNELLYSRFIFSNKNQNLLPKWLLSSINRQLNEIGESNKIDMVLEEVFKIKNEIGNPSLSTPVGQIIGSQAILNTIISDHRWEITSDEIKKLISGNYGKLPRKVDKDVFDKIIESDRAYGDPSGSGTGEAAGETIEVIEDKTLEQCADEIIGFSKRDVDILSYLFFPEKTFRFLENKNDPNISRPKLQSKPEVQELIFPDYFDEKKDNAKFTDIDLKKIREITTLVETSDIDGINIEIDGMKISINKKMDQQKDMGPAKDTIFSDTKKPDIGEEGLVSIRSPIVGTFYSASEPGAPPFITAGKKVKKGDTLCIIEAMKLLNKIDSDYDGEIREILVQNEDAIEYDQVLIRMKPHIKNS